MTKPQIIYQDDQPAFVVVPYADWLATINEDQADEMALQQALADDDGTRYPQEVITRLMAGEQPIKVYREFHGMTQEQLAQKAGVTKVYISQLERGHRNMSNKLRAKIASILDVDPDNLTAWEQS
ncbi:helix-turn-helix transcriptional regulator (plasmid) [Thalassospira sp. SM2505]